MGKGIDMEDSAAVENCYRRMYRAMVEKTESVLQAVLHPSFVLVHMTGLRQSKAEFIRAIQNSTLNYYAADHQQIHVRLQGDWAELIGQSLVSAAVFGGGRHTWRLQLQCKLVREGGIWRIIEALASTY